MQVTEYKYLGRLVTSVDNDISKEIAQQNNIRVEKMWRSIATILNDTKIPICLKRKIMDTVILPAMTYGAETWALTKHQEKHGEIVVKHH